MRPYRLPSPWTVALVALACAVMLRVLAFAIDAAAPQPPVCGAGVCVGGAYVIPEAQKDSPFCLVTYEVDGRTICVPANP